MSVCDICKQPATATNVEIQVTDTLHPDDIVHGIGDLCDKHKSELDQAVYQIAYRLQNKKELSA